MIQDSPSPLTTLPPKVKEPLLLMCIYLSIYLYKPLSLLLTCEEQLQFGDVYSNEKMNGGFMNSSLYQFKSIGIKEFFYYL